MPLGEAKHFGCEGSGPFRGTVAEGKVGRKGQGCNQRESEEVMTEWPYAGVRVPLTNIQAKGDRAKKKGLLKTNSTQPNMLLIQG